VIVHLQKTLSKYKITIPPRRLITLYRLISAVAKLHLRDRANISDVNEALDLYKESLATLGEVTPEILQIMEAPTTEAKLGETIKNTMIKGQEYHINDLKDLIKANPNDIDRVVSALCREGWLMEVKHNLYRRAE